MKRALAQLESIRHVVTTPAGERSRAGRQHHLGPAEIVLGRELHRVRCTPHGVRWKPPPLLPGTRSDCLCVAWCMPYGVWCTLETSPLPGRDFDNVADLHVLPLDRAELPGGLGVQHKRLRLIHNPVVPVPLEVLIALRNQCVSISIDLDRY